METFWTFNLLGLSNPKELVTFKQLKELESELFERFCCGIISRPSYNRLWVQIDQRFKVVPNA